MKLLFFLVPKKNRPKKVTKFRPISLYNVVCKIIIKVIVTRLKSILPHVVSNSQSAFVLNGLIIDIVLVAFETVHCIRKKRREKGYDVFKVRYA